MFLAFAMAQTAQGQAAPPTPGLADFLLPFSMVIFVFYLMYMRPQQEKLKQHQTMLNALKRGDNVITSGGIFGQVTGITDKFVTLEVAENVRIRVLRSQVSGAR